MSWCWFFELKHHFVSRGEGLNLLGRVGGCTWGVGDLEEESGGFVGVGGSGMGRKWGTFGSYWGFGVGKLDGFEESCFGKSHCYLFGHSFLMVLQSNRFVSCLHCENFALLDCD